MSSSIPKRAAWAFTVANLAFVAGSVAFATQRDASAGLRADAHAASRPDTRGNGCAATPVVCERCATFGFEVALPQTMAAAEPIATF